MHLPIYMDSHATTPCDSRVVEAMLPAFTETFGNAASRNHAFGWEAEALVKQAREQVGALLHCEPEEIIFTSGATESNNTAIKGMAAVYGGKGRHVVTCVTEHKAVLDPCRWLEGQGFRVTYLPVNEEGLLQVDGLRGAIEPETILVSIMFANNEIGAIQPIAEIGRVCKERGVIFHCDATQAPAHERIDASGMGIDLLSLSAHKMYGPKGVGALYVRRRNPRVRLEPLLHGGGHERGLRSGTLNVPGIIGLGKAAEIVIRERESDAARIRDLRDLLLARIRAKIPGIIVHGTMKQRLPNNLNISLPGALSETVMARLPEVAISSGAACSSATLEPSHVLLALGFSREVAESSLRFGLHRFTTREEVEFAAAQLAQTYAQAFELPVGKKFD